MCENPVFRDIPRSRKRRGISHCLENIQSEIPRLARNDSLIEILTQTLKPRPSDMERWRRADAYAGLNEVVSRIFPQAISSTPVPP